jgi:hypothetical protein
VQKFQAVPITVSKVRGNGDAGSRFDGRHNGGKTVVLLIPSSSLKADTKMKTTNLHLREFVKNSRVLAAFTPGGIELPQFFFPRKPAFRNIAGIRYANATANERNLNP